MGHLGAVSPSATHRQLVPISSLDLRGRAVLVEGQIARESSVAEGLVNRRWAQLLAGTATEPPLLVSYRRQGDAEPSKCWALTGQCTLSEPQQHAMKLRVNHSTLVAHVAGLSTPVVMTCFTLHFNSGKLWGANRLTLCFESSEVARGWHRKLATAIAGQASQRSLLAPEAHAPPSANSDEHTTPRSRSGPPESPSRQLLAEMAEMVEESAAAGPDSESIPPRSWRSVHHVNGVTVYAEEEGPDGEGGGYMISAVVRASPDDTFKAIMQQPFSHDARMMFGHASILEVIDPRAQVVLQTWQPGGVWGRFWASREMVLLRTWRHERDGTYIVIYQSTQHGGAREARGGFFNWGQPVRAKVEAAGYTVAPLLPKYTKHGESQECLVTLVVKVDLGGWMSPGSLMSSLIGSMLEPWLKPMILSVVALRDRVEQSRFVLGAPSMGAGVAAPTPRTSMDGPGAVTASHRKLSVQQSTQQLSAAAALGMEAAAEGQAAAAAAGEEGGSPPPSEDPEQDNFPKPSEEEAWAVEGTCHRCWTCPGASGLKIRGKGYLKDKKKIPAAVPMFDLYAADLLDVDEPLWHVARFLPSVKYSREPFLFIMQLMIPCSPPQSLTIVWSAPVNPMTADMDTLLEYYPEDEQGTVRAFFTNFKAWLEGDGKEADKRRNTKFKLIPQVVKGSWIVKQSVGTTPVLLGQKLLTRYFRGPNYFEVDVDITANTVAASVTSLVVGAITSLVVDLCVVIEGQSEAELPERLVGTVRFSHLRLKNAAYLDEETGKIYRGDRPV